MKKGILKHFPVQAAHSDTQAFSPHWGKISLGMSELFAFSAQNRFAPLS